MIKKRNLFINAGGIMTEHEQKALKEYEEYDFFFSSLKKAGPAQNEMIESAFKFWKRMWTLEFNRLGKKMPDWSDEFYRHDYIGVVSYKGRPLAMHLYGLQNLGISPCENSRYMTTNFTPEFAPTLRERGIERALSLNWLTVDILLARTIPDISLIEVMGGLGAQVCEWLSFDALIAAIRKDVPLADKAQTLGMKSLGTKDVYGGPCDLCYTTLESRELLGESSRSLINYLWEKRDAMDITRLENAVNEVMAKIGCLNAAKRPDLYTNFLAQTHYFVKHSVPLLEAAITKSSNQEFIKRSKAHIKEESGHDIIALRDLQKMGGDISNFPEWEWTKSFYGRQYELIESEGELLLGYILALEWIAAKGKEEAREIEKAYGKKTSKFVEVHVEEDQDHLLSAIEQIQKSKHKDKILENFFQTIEEYQGFLDLLDQTERGEKAA